MYVSMKPCSPTLCPARRRAQCSTTVSGQVSGIATTARPHAAATTCGQKDRGQRQTRNPPSTTYARKQKCSTSTVVASAAYTSDLDHRGHDHRAPPVGVVDPPPD